MLGWSNDAKIAALARQEHDLATRISSQAAQIVTLKREVEDDNNVYGLWQQLAVYAHFAELDWQALMASIDLLCTTRKQLAQCDVLAAATLSSFAGLHAQVRNHLRTLLEHASGWERILAGLHWFVAHHRLRAVLPAVHSCR